MSFLRQATSILNISSGLPARKCADTVQSVGYARSLCDEVQFSAEDASRTDPEFLCEVFRTAIASGACVVNIADTVGYAVPAEFASLVRSIIDGTPNIGSASVSVHCHNDLGLAVANSLAAVKAGADQVECTVNGLGERAGNAAMEEIVMALTTRSGAEESCRCLCVNLSNTSLNEAQGYEQ